MFKFNNKVFKTREEVEDEVRSYAEETYDDMLDDCYPEVNICGFTYSASRAWESVDSIAYRCGFSDYENWLYDDIEEIEDEEDSDE